MNKQMSKNKIYQFKKVLDEGISMRAISVIGLGVEETLCVVFQ